MKYKKMSSLLTRLAIIVLAIGLIAGIASSAMAAKDPSAITTDKTKYSLGETMVIYGTGFTPDGTVNIEVQLPGNNGIDILPPVTTDGVGSFQTSYTPPMIPGRYKITATDGTNTAKTAATVADDVGYKKGVYRKDTTAIVLPTGKWTTGNAGKYYKEDQWAYYQYEIIDIPGSDVPTFNVVYNHYQQNSNAIFIDAFCDFRYAWNTSMLANDVPYPGNSTSAMSTWHTWTPKKINWAYDPSAHTLSSPSTNAPAEFNGFAVDDPASMFATGAPTTGTNTLVIYFRAHLASSAVWMAGDEGSLGSLIPPDDQAVPSGAAGIFGADVYTSWNASFYGVGFATGSSRHFTLQDQSAGPSGAITLPIPTVGANYLIIQKVTDPTPATDALFGFNASSDPNGNISPTTFMLDTDPGTTTIYEMIRFSDLPTGHGGNAVDYIFTETTLPEHWSLTDITCEDILETSTFTVDLSAKTVTVTLAVDGAAICTFNNTREKTGCLNVTKEIDMSGLEDGGLIDLDDAQFSVNVTGPSYPDGTIVQFRLNGGVLEVYDGSWEAGNSSCLCDLIPGNYTATEEAPAGWEEAELDPVSGEVTVEAGDECDDIDVLITVTNAPTPGCLEVTKEIDWSGITGDPADVPAVNFTVTVTGPSYPSGHNLTFHLVNGNVTYNGELDATACLCGLIPGNYTVTETPPDGWEAANITNDDPAVVVAGTECDDSAIEVIVINTLTPPSLTCGTAVAAMDPAPGTPTPGKFWPLGTTQSNWFTYITYNKTRDGTETVYPIYYGQDQLAGWLYVRDDGTHVAVNFTLNETMGECDVAGISSYHVEVAPSLNDLAVAVCNKGGEGNPVPGKCDYKGTVDPMDTTTGWIECDEDEDDISNWNNPIYIFAHAKACWYCP